MLQIPPSAPRARLADFATKRSNFNGLARFFTYLFSAVKSGS